MPALHVAQVNFLPAPDDRTPTEVLDQWPTLVDVAEAVAGAGTRVSVIQAATRAAHVLRHGIGYHFTGSGGAGATVGWGRRVAELLAGIEADVVHVNGLAFAADAFALAQRLPRLPIVLQDHADRPPRRWRRARWRRWLAVAAGAAFTAPELALPFISAGLLQPSTRLFAIAESTSRFVPGSRARARAQTGLHGDPCVLWVGHLSPGKDPLTVLDGVAGAVSRLPGLQLWCAYGSAPLLAEVHRRIAGDPRLTGRVHLLGNIAHAHVEALMRAADLFVSGSLAESCGYAVLEAIACGLAPVVTDIPAFRALTGNGRVGKLWPRGDPAQLAEALVRTALGGRSVERVRAHFDAALSSAAIGRHWAEAYALVHDDQLRRAR